MEIRCPADCGYLSAAKTHPPAVVQRQQATDRNSLLPYLSNLTERQGRLLIVLASVIARHGVDTTRSNAGSALLEKLRDEDVVDAAKALAATLETAVRGIVYEHRPESLLAARLMTDLRQAIDEAVKHGGSALERDAAVVLRRLEQAAAAAVGERRDSNAFQQRLARLLSPLPAESPVAEPPPSLIIT